MTSGMTRSRNLNIKVSNNSLYEYEYQVFHEMSYMRMKLNSSYISLYISIGFE